MNILIKYFIVAFLLFIAVGANAQNNKSLGERSKKEGRRIALVIGNEDYDAPMSKLKNIYNDAKAMDATLKKLGFQTSLYLNLTNAQTGDVLIKFVKSLSTNDVAFLYYSGHGVGYDGKSYMVPVDFGNGCNEVLENKAISFEDIQMVIERKKVQNFFLVADACRDEFCGKKSLKGNYELTVPSDNPKGHFVAFAADYSKTADYRSRGNKNSLYTESLLLFLNQPLEVNEIFRRARNRTYEESKRLLGQGQIDEEVQTPDFNSRIFGDFYFMKPKNTDFSQSLNPLSAVDTEEFINDSSLKPRKTMVIPSQRTGVISSPEKISTEYAVVPLTGSVCFTNADHIHGRRVSLKHRNSGYTIDMIVARASTSKGEPTCKYEIPAGIYECEVFTTSTNLKIGNFDMRIPPNQTINKVIRFDGN